MRAENDGIRTGGRADVGINLLLAGIVDGGNEKQRGSVEWQRIGRRLCGSGRQGGDYRVREAGGTDRDRAVAEEGDRFSDVAQIVVSLRVDHDHIRLTLADGISQGGGVLTGHD